MRLNWLDPDAPPDFPDPGAAWTDPDGLLALGGRLNTPWLLAAYCQGIFPWFGDDDPILWWSPQERAVFYPGSLHLSRRMRRRLSNTDGISIRLGADFSRIVDLCARLPRPGQDGTWITSEMQAAYGDLYQAGYATSIAVYNRKTLIGGLYGVTLGHMFCGESMFSLESGASSLALLAADFWMQQGRWHFLDAQIPSPHLARLGARTVSRARFRTDLAAALPAASQAETRVQASTLELHEIL